MEEKKRGCKCIFAFVCLLVCNNGGTRIIIQTQCIPQTRSRTPRTPQNHPPPRRLRLSSDGEEGEATSRATPRSLLSFSMCRPIYSTLPLALAPRSGALKSFMPRLSSRRRRVRRRRPRNHEAPPIVRPRVQAMVRKGCSEMVMRMSKKVISMLEMVSLGLILGGEAVTLLIVSEMDVRDGRMGLPVMVWSQ